MKTLIKNAEIVTMTGEKYKNGCILFDEKIQYVGEDKVFEADKIIDAEGKIVMPGLIDAHCHVGMFEDSLGFEGDDGNEDSDPIMPHLRAIDGINPFDRGFKDAYNAGCYNRCNRTGQCKPCGRTVCGG